MKRTSVIFTSLMLTLGILASIAYLGSEHLGEYRDEIELGGVVEIPENDMGEIEEVNEDEIEEDEQEDEQEAENVVEDTFEDGDILGEENLVERPIEGEDKNKEESVSEEQKENKVSEEQEHESSGTVTQLNKNVNKENKEEQKEQEGKGQQNIKTYSTSVEYGTEEYTATLEGNGGDEMNNFTYKTITIGDYVLMDRNLGAIEPWNKTVSDEYLPSYGYYYQWGNKYGFKYGITPNTSNEPVEATNDSTYSNSTWITTSPWNINSTMFDELRGYGGSLNDMQGPCPNGFHVPSEEDWISLIESWCLIEKNDPECSNGYDYGSNFAESLLLPYAGYREKDSLSFNNFGGAGGYWSSTPSDTNSAIHININFGISSSFSSSRADGAPIRCMKNYSTRKINFHPNGGNVSRLSTEIRKGGLVIKPKMPTKENKIFLGWFTDEELTKEFDFSTPITSDINLYAKWGEGGIEYIRDKGMVKIWAGDSLYYLKDRNVGVDKNVDVLELMNKYYHGCENEDGCSEAEVKNIMKELGGNYYFWGNNTPIVLKNLLNQGNGVMDEDGRVNPSVIPEGFNYGKIGEENTGWGEGENDNPCNGEGEYLPTVKDWAHIMEIYSSIKGRDFINIVDDDEDVFGISMQDDYELGEQVFDFMMHPSWSFSKDGENLYADLGAGIYLYVWTAKNDNYYYGVRNFDAVFGSKNYDDEANYMAFPIRCFVNPVETFNVEFNSNGGSAVESQSVSSGDRAEEPNNPRLEGKVFDGWYTDTTLKNEFDFSTPITSNITLYAKWVNGGIEYLKDEGVVRIYIGDKEYYIRDRNVGVDKNLDVEDAINGFLGCITDDDCSDNESWNYIKSLGGNVYFWGNNTGVNTNEMSMDDEGNITIGLVPEGFDHGRLFEDNTGRGEGENGNPCNGIGEYLPTVKDWKNLYKMYGQIKGFGLIPEIEYEDSFAYYIGFQSVDEIFSFYKSLIYSPGVPMYEDFLSDFESATYGSTWATKDGDGYMGYHYMHVIYGTKDPEEIKSLNEMAMPVRCFVHPQNESNNQEKSNQQSSYSGGGGRVIGNNSINKVVESSGKEHNSASNSKELNKKITQQESSKSKLSTEGLLGRYYNYISKEDNEAYVRARDNNITTLPPEEANPNGYVNRGEMAKMVVNFAVNVLGEKLPEKYPQCKWEDDANDWDSKELKGYATKACALGLMGINTEYFNPKKEVTRAQFGTILSRMLRGNDFNIRDTKEKPYYTDHLKALKANGIMDIITNADKTKEVRKWIWLMMKRTTLNK